MAAAGALTGLAGCGILGDDEGVTLGVAFPLTGVYSASASAQGDGVEMAVQEINDEGGINGQEVDVVSRDTELGADTSARRVNDLLRTEEVDLLVANLSGGISVQTQEQASQNNTPFVTGCQTIPAFRPAETGCFSGGTLNGNHAWSLVDTAFDEDLGNAFYGVVADYGWGNSTWSFAQQRIEEQGGSIVGSSRHPLGNDDYSSILNDIDGSDVEVVFITNAGGDTANFLQQANEFGILEEYEFVHPTNAHGWVQIPPKELWEGVYTGFQWYPVEGDEQANEWAQKMEDEFGYYGDTYAAITYNATRELARAANEEESLDPEDIDSNFKDSDGFSYVTDYNENWRPCDHGMLTEVQVVRGKPESEMGERGNWDLFESARSYAGEETLPECPYW